MSRIRTLLTITFTLLLVIMLGPVFVASAQTPGADQGTGTPGAMASPEATSAATGAGSEGTATTGPAVSVRNQALQDNRVVIGNVRSDGPGWLVIHNATADGSVGPDIGHTPLTNGDNPHVVVALEKPELVTENMFAMVHVDRGVVGVYEFPGPDVPAVADGKVLNFAFSITGGLTGGAASMPATTAESSSEMTMETATPATMAGTPGATAEMATPDMTPTP